MRERTFEISEYQLGKLASAWMELAIYDFLLQTSLKSDSCQIITKANQGG
jgi:hypothetical protein